MSDIRIPLADLRIGHYVKLPLSWKQHPFLFSAFRIKDESQLAIILTLGLDEIVVDPSKSTVEISIPPVAAAPPPPSVKQHDIPVSPHKAEQQQLRRAIRTAEKAFTNSVSPLRESLTKLNLKPDEGLGTVAELVRNASAHLQQHEGPVGLQLIRITDQADSLLLHSLNVAFIAMLIAKEAGWSPLEIEDAGLAGLLHDLGELKIPTQITHKRTELSKSEVNYLRMHPQYGYEQLNAIGAFSVKVRLAAYQHHERLDGSGYPQGLSGDKLVDQRAKMTRLPGFSASNFDHPGVCATIRFLDRRTWGVNHGNRAENTAHASGGRPVHQCHRQSHRPLSQYRSQVPSPTSVRAAQVPPPAACQA